MSSKTFKLDEEIEELPQQTNKERLLDTITSLREAEKYGIDSIIRLGNQRETIERNTEKTEKIQDSLQKSNQILKSMSSTFGRITKKRRHVEKISGRNKKDKNDVNEGLINENAKLIDNKKKSKDDLLDEISDSLQHLKMISGEMGRELKEQNKMLEEQGEMVKDTSFMIRLLNKKITDLL